MSNNTQHQYNQGVKAAQQGKPAPPPQNFPTWQEKNAFNAGYNNQKKK